ncbi:unnamed protein product, partial [Callosobruchus maculatus]
CGVSFSGWCHRWSRLAGCRRRLGCRSFFCVVSFSRWCLRWSRLTGCRRRLGCRSFFCGVSFNGLGSWP